MSEGLRFPWDVPAVPVAPSPDPDPPIAKPKRRGRRPAALTHAAAARSPPDWLYHHPTISGPANCVERFAAAARGAGITPWRLEGSDIEDTVFNLAVSQPARDRKLTVEGCRILARQFRDRLEARQVRAAVRVGHSRACPFDLHTLLPVPAPILQLGPTHPTALEWLTAHWGLTDGLRQVSVLAKPSSGRRLPRGNTLIGYGFFTPGETPHAAITVIAARWPALRFQIVPRPAD